MSTYKGAFTFREEREKVILSKKLDMQQPGPSLRSRPSNFDNSNAPAFHFSHFKLRFIYNTSSQVSLLTRAR